MHLSSAASNVDTTLLYSSSRCGLRAALHQDQCRGINTYEPWCGAALVVAAAAQRAFWVKQVLVGFLLMLLMPCACLLLQVEVSRSLQNQLKLESHNPISSSSWGVKQVWFVKTKLVMYLMDSAPHVSVLYHSPMIPVVHVHASSM